VVNNTGIIEDLLDSLNFGPAMGEIATTLSTLLTAFLANQTAPLVKLPPLPEGQKPLEFYNSTWNLGAVFNETLGRVSERFFSEVLRMRVARIHIASMMNFVNFTLQNTLLTNPLAKPLNDRQVNVTLLIPQILDELFGDQAMWNYFGWFFYPTSTREGYLEFDAFKFFKDPTAKRPATTRH